MTSPASTKDYKTAGKNQAQGAAKVESGNTVEGKQQKAEGVATAQKEPNIDINDVTNISN